MSEERQLNLELQQIFYTSEQGKPREEEFPLPGGRKFIVGELTASEVVEVQMESYRWRMENPGQPDIFYEGRILVRAVMDENRKRVWADDQAVEIMSKPQGLIDPLMLAVNRVNENGRKAKDAKKNSSTSAPNSTDSSASSPPQESSTQPTDSSR